MATMPKITIKVNGGLSNEELAAAIMVATTENGKQTPGSVAEKLWVEHLGRLLQIQAARARMCTMEDAAQ